MWWVERESYFESKHKKKINETCSKTFVARLIAVLAATRLYPNYLPNSTNKLQIAMMEHLTVLLTPEQMDVYYSENKHLIIKGGFGCGKSIIARAMLQKISANMEKSEKLFYICFDPRSELLNQIVKNRQGKRFDGVTPFHNKYGLQLSAIIEHITKSKRSEKINLVIDEYDGEDLDESEAERLNYIFSGSLNEAFIALIPQPIEKKRLINNVQ